MSKIRISLVGVLLAVLLSLSSVVSAASSTRFCKCTCFKTSTIIELKPHTNDPNDPSLKKPADNKQPATPSTLPASSPGNTDRDPCKQCNIAFCLSQTLPDCKEADPERDVKTFCFQRDRTEDQVIVWAFILGTLGLLGWAGLRALIDARDRKHLATAGAQAGAGQGQQGGLPFSSTGPETTAGTAGGLWQRIMGTGSGGGGGAGQARGGTYAPLDDTGR
ncbi:hypothetical protein V8F33_009607 [Rhypophila sp. PSN 637]